MTNPSFVYLKSDGSPILVSEGSAIPDYMTVMAPSSKFDQWNEVTGAWEFNRDRWLDEEIRPERNVRLDAADRRVRRHDYQVRAGVATTDSVESIASVLNYMQELRDLPQTAHPQNFAWPSVP
jgi:hypothetical protein